jgi:drug/metabolite transporter (DMT)-like permease
VKKFILLLAIAIIWGSQFILNEEAIQIISPFELAFYRIAFGALALSIIIALPVIKEPKIVWTKNLVLLLIALNLTESVIPFIMNGFGQKEVSSSVTSVLMASIPMITIVLDFLINKKKIGGLALIGVIIGFLGIVVLVYQDLLVQHNVSLLSIAYILIGAFGFAFSLILMAKIPKDVPSLRFTRAILVSGAITTLPLTLGDNHFDFIDLNLWIKLIILGSFASGIVYYMYLFLVRSAGPVFTSLTNYLVPVVGVVLGVMVNHEHFGLGHYLGFSIIMLGLILINWKELKAII